MLALFMNASCFHYKQVTIHVDDKKYMQNNSVTLIRKQNQKM